MLVETGPVPHVLVMMMEAARLVDSERFGRRVRRRVVDATRRIVVVVIIIVVSVGVGRRRRDGDRRDGPLLLHEAVQFEPVGAAAVAGAALGHAHQQALAEAAGLARRPVLLVDDALAAVFALGDHRQIVVGSAEERL